MITVGRKIYFDKKTGSVLVRTAALLGSVLPTTIEQDIENYSALSERNRETFDVIELEYGQYEEDFGASDNYRVNPETKMLEFSYPDPNEPEVEQPYQVPLSEEVTTLKATNEDLSNYVLEMDMRLVMIEMGI